MFPGARTDRDAADYVVVGAPLDASTSFRPGARFGPDRVRRFAEPFDDYDRRTDRRFSDLAVHDAGDVRAWDDAPEYLAYLEGTCRDVVWDGAVPLLLGGEHTVTSAAVRAVEPDVLVVVDAHLDLRAEYDGNPWSHATVVRRLLDGDPDDGGTGTGEGDGGGTNEGDDGRANNDDGRASNDDGGASDDDGHGASDDGGGVSGDDGDGRPLGGGPVDEAVILGARAGSEAEWDRAEESDVIVVPPEDVAEWTPDFDADATAYLSIDIDGADPGFAPGTGTPEPFGLAPREMRDVVRAVAPRAAGFDVVEVNDRDDGQAASLAGKLLREFVLSHAAER